jgi:glycogen debranching enzyme GlgX
MVKALHRAGIEVILDVVYNHTAEGNDDGPTLCFRGLANENYYILAEDKSRYADYTGSGNTFNTNEPIVRRLIIDSLRWWVSEMHVDGFRFDLASILSRDPQGRPTASPPILWDIESDPVLANAKLIAEAWDAAGLYQVGTFVGDSWTEWNGRFRDDVRAFLKGDNGTVRSLAFRLTGSPDVFEREEREAEQSINFVTCHDGFTLNDLVSFNNKHNEANGEGNRDGADHNRSWNCGTECPTADPEVERLRRRQVKNFLTLTLLAIGTPMLLMGDEVRRSQGGNNNAYCQNTEISWFDWALASREARGCSSLRQRAYRALHEPRAAGQAARFDAQRTSAPTTGPVARSQIACSGLEPRIPHPGGHGPLARLPAAASPYDQRLLGGARIRYPAARTARVLAPVRRYLPRSAGRYPPVGRRPDAKRFGLPGSASLRRPSPCSSVSKPRRRCWNMCGNKRTMRPCILERMHAAITHSF